MLKTNVFYNAIVTDNGSSLSSETPFSAENISNLKSNVINDCLFVWGNAYRGVGFATKSPDATPTSSSFSSFNTSSVYTDGSVPHAQSLLGASGTSISLGLDLGSQQYADRIRIIINGAPEYVSLGFYNPGPGDIFRVYSSNDNSTWTLINNWSFSGISVTGGEIVLSFTRTLARYFKVTMPYGNIQVMHNPNVVLFYPYYQKVYILDTTAGYQFKAKIDLGAHYTSPTIYLQTRLKRDHLNWSVKSSSDDISYSTNSLSFGNTWTSDTSLTTFGKLLFNKKTGRLFCVSTTGIREYNFALETWSNYDVDSTLITYLSIACALDEERNIIYSYSYTANKAIAYFIDYKTFRVLPSLPFTVPSIVSGSFVFDRFFLSINSSNQSTYPNRLGSAFLCYSYLDDKWRLTDFRGLSISYMDKHPIQPNELFYNGTEYMLIPGFSNYSASGACLISPSFSSTFSGFGSSTYDGMTIFDFFNQKQGNISTPLGGGRPLAVLDSDKNFLFFLVHQNGNLGSYGTFERRYDFFIDLSNSDIHVFPDNNYGSAGQVYHIGGLEPLGSNSVCYVPDAKRIYRTGAFELSGAGTDFKYYDSEEFISVKAALATNTRYITIDNTSTGHWPMMINQLEVIEKNSELGFGESPSSFFCRKNVEFNLTDTSLVYEIPVYNNKGVAAPSGIAFIEPNGVEGSRCFEISDSDTGPWYPHCFYNDLTNSVCTAGSSLYGTTKCGVACTSGTAGISATGFYTPNHVPISATASGIDYLYLRGNMPSFATAEDKPFDIIAEFYE